MDTGMSDQGATAVLREYPFIFCVYGQLMNVSVSDQGEAMALSG